MRTIALLTLSTFAFSSCVSTRSIKVSELAKLDGYREDDPEQKTRVLAAADSTESPPESVTIERGTHLAFHLTNGRLVEGQFSRFDLTNAVLNGMLTDGIVKSVDLKKVTSAETYWYSAGKTTGLVAAIVGGGFLLFCGVAYLGIAAGGGIHF
jgi:hypothetical protein